MPPMPELVYYVAASEDGFIAGPRGELDWLRTAEVPGEDYGYATFLAGVDGLLMGRVTCEAALSFGPWPYGARPSWVLTRGRGPDGLPASVRCTAASPREVMQQAQARGLRRLWLVGGGALAAQCARDALLDDVVLSTVPCRLGQGIGLFDPWQAWREAYSPAGEARHWPSGLVQQRFRRRG